MPILKPVISMAVAGAIALSAYTHLNADNRGQIASVEKVVVDTVGSGIGWLSATIASWVPYRLPEMQPNGDIVIKRLPPAEQPQPSERDLPETGPPPAAAATNT